MVNSSASPPPPPGKETEIILPPPSEKNPIPSLSAALRVDNQEQLLQFLLDRPSSNASSSSAPSMNQCFVFGSASLRTLIMRQVLTDPHMKHALSSKNPAQPRWDAPTAFPGLPRNLNVLGTALLEDNADSVVPLTVDVITYFLRPTNFAQTQRVADFILHCQQNHRLRTNINNISTQHHRILYLPHASAMIYKILSSAGLIGPNSTNPITVHSLPLDLFPVEPDVLTMEFPDALRELHVEGTPSAMITQIARSLLKLQDIVGTVPRIQSYGVAAEQVVRKMLDLAVDEHCAVNPASMPEVTLPSETVAALVVMDRKIDMVTPLLTPLTYEGLLDDVVGIDYGFLNIDVDILNPPEETSGSDEKELKRLIWKDSIAVPVEKLVSLAINESDSMFGEIRNQHVEQFGTYLQNQAKSMQATQKDFKETGKQKELSELHKFVKQLPGFKQKFQSLSTHIHLAELVKYTSEDAMFRERWQMERTMLEGDMCLDELDDLVAMSYHPYRFLRLLCLQSICKNGINSSRYDSLRKDVVQTYGYEFLSLLMNLEKAGLLRRKEAFLGMDKASAFSKVKDLLVLINAEVDTVEPDDISYVSSGYAPMTVRVLQSAVTGWKNGRDDILREIPGRFIDIVQQSPPEDLTTTMQRAVSTGVTYGSLAPTSLSRIGKKQVLIVVYIGGITYMEMTALRFLSKRSNFPYHIICVTTSILNGNTLLQSLC
jgi:vacuolar protein sorting-associated protein 33A